MYAGETKLYNRYRGGTSAISPAILLYCILKVETSMTTTEGKMNLVISVEHRTCLVSVLCIF